MEEFTRDINTPAHAPTTKNNLYNGNMKHGLMKQLQGKRQFKPGKVGREREKKSKLHIFKNPKTNYYECKKFFFLKKKEIENNSLQNGLMGDQCTFKISK